MEVRPPYERSGNMLAPDTGCWLQNGSACHRVTKSGVLSHIYERLA